MLAGWSRLRTPDRSQGLATNGRALLGFFDDRRSLANGYLLFMEILAFGDGNDKCQRRYPHTHVAKKGRCQLALALHLDSGKTWLA